MVNESKLIELFKSLLGDKYKIIPSSSAKQVDEDPRSKKASDKTTNKTSDKILKHHSAIDQENQVSAEAMALFERDKRKYGISVSTEQSDIPLTANEKAIMKKAQADYNRIVDSLSNKIDTLSGSRETARKAYIDILRTSDQDDPYRVSNADLYNPQYIQEQINYYKRIKQDPFYGRIVLQSDDGKLLDYYIGRIAFESEGIMIVSPWSDLGKILRYNKLEFTINGTDYTVLYKYTFISKDHRIIGVKDDSPR